MWFITLTIRSLPGGETALRSYVSLTLAELTHDFKIFPFGLNLYHSYNDAVHA